MDLNLQKLMTLVFMTTVAIAHADTRIEVETLSENAHKLTVKSDEVNDVAAAQASLMERATELCGALHVVMGRYTFNKSELISQDGNNAQDTFELEQELTCETEIRNNSQKPQSSNNAETVFEPGQLEEKAQGVFDQYMHLLNKKKYKTAYQLLSEGNQRITPYKEWRKNKKAFRKESGGSGKYENLKLTWYDNPPNASEPGVYVAFDFTCVFPELERCSGVLILHQTPSGAFKVVREESNLMDKKTAASIDKMELSIKPHQTARITIQQWQDYLQLAILKYADSVYDINEQCINHVIAKDINVWLYFTQDCHPAYPAWVTLYLNEEGGQIGLGQIGYFAGDEPAFAQFFQKMGAVRQRMIDGIKSQKPVGSK